MMVYKKAEVRYEPLGVIAALVSWKYERSFIPHEIWLANPELVILFVARASHSILI